MNPLNVFSAQFNEFSEGDSDQTYVDDLLAFFCTVWQQKTPHFMALRGEK